MEKFDAFLETFDFVATKGNIPATEKRKLTAKFVQEAVLEFAASEEETANTIAAAWRTGGRMEVSSNFDKIRPNRFPDGFGASILRGHPNYGLAKPYTPLFIGLRPVVVPPLPAPVLVVAEASGGAVMLTPQGGTVTGGTARVQVMSGAELVARGGNASVDTHTGTFEATGGTVTITPPSPPPHPGTVQYLNLPRGPVSSP